MIVAGAPGDGLPGLERLARALGTSSHVRFVGRVDHAEKVRLLQTCASYLQPSVFEGFGVAAAEAMAAGAPVVACRTGTLPEVLGEHAFFASDRTPHSVAEATERALTDFTPERAIAASQRITTRYSFEVRRSAIARILRAATSRVDA
jgi:glycosyltransferase involved in cell wall biosynthesis